SRSSKTPQGSSPISPLEGEPSEAPPRSPRRGPPYWKSRVLRRQALGEEDDAASHARGAESRRSRRGGQRGPRGVAARGKTRPKALPGSSGRTCPGVHEAPWRALARTLEGGVDSRIPLVFLTLSILGFPPPRAASRAEPRRRGGRPAGGSPRASSPAAPHDAASDRSSRRQSSAPCTRRRSGSAPCAVPGRPRRSRALGSLQVEQLEIEQLEVVPVAPVAARAERVIPLLRLPPRGDRVLERLKGAEMDLGPIDEDGREPSAAPLVQVDAGHPGGVGAVAPVVLAVLRMRRGPQIHLAVVERVVVHVVDALHAEDEVLEHLALLAAVLLPRPRGVEARAPVGPDALPAHAPPLRAAPAAQSSPSQSTPPVQ